MTRRAIIVGAGVAGLSAAWWLGKAGWRSIVVERAQSLRDGGHMMSLSGPGHETARRMDLLDLLTPAAHPGGESIYFDRRGRELLRFRHRELMRDFPYLVIRRGDVVNAIVQRMPPGCEIRLASEVAAVAPEHDRVAVTLSNGSNIEADLLIAADGVNSRMRRAHFAPDADVMTPLGYRFASYEIPDIITPKADFFSYAHPGRISEFYQLSEGRFAALHVWIQDPQPNQAEIAPFDELTQVFADDHPDVRAIIAAGARENRPPLIDDMMLVEAPAWSKGRIVLIGDAAHCITLISGQGAGMAMTGAAVLAGEIAARDDLPQALAAYEGRMRGTVGRLQERSRNIARWFVPRSKLAFHWRNTVLRAMPRALLRRYFRRSFESEILASSIDAGVSPASH
jgi:2-polyprenyl-6-methoxyphenol hydroxylase-like FAD-dependent oxidoreductase